MIQVIHATKSYKKNEVLSDVTLDFHEGEIAGLVGANGSGKTVLLKAISGYIQLDSGKVLQDDVQIREHGNYIQNAGIVIENPGFINEYTLLENLQFIAKFSPSKKIDVSYWLDVYSITQHQHKKFKHLSLGTKQKMLIIQAFMHEPDVLLLDEIFNALDKDSVAKTKDLLLEYKKQGKTIILSSHLHNETDELCDIIYRIQEGSIIESIRN